MTGPFEAGPAEPPSGRVALIGVPVDESSSFLRGAAEGPRAIREALFERHALAANARKAAEELVWEADAGALVELYEHLKWRS